MSWKLSGIAKGITHGKNGDPIERGEKLLLLILSDYANEKTLSCFPSVATLAEECICSERTIQRESKRLEELGLLRIQREEGRSNTYLLTLDVTPVNLSPLSPTSPSSDIAVTPGGDIAVTPEPEVTVREPEKESLPFPKPAKKEKTRNFPSRTFTRPERSQQEPAWVTEKKAREEKERIEAEKSAKFWKEFNEKEEAKKKGTKKGFVRILVDGKVKEVRL